MNEQEIFDKVKAIIVDILAIDEESVSPEAGFREDLGADSLDLVELIMAFEEEFNGQISDEDARSITTVQGAVNYVSERMLASE
jgi:acyl carrier protein